MFSVHSHVVKGRLTQCTIMSVIKLVTATLMVKPVSRGLPTINIDVI